MKISKSNLFLILMFLPMIVGAIVTIVQVSDSEEYAISSDNQTITSQHQTSHETKIDQKRTKIDPETAIAIKNIIKQNKDTTYFFFVIAFVITTVFGFPKKKRFTNGDTNIEKDLPQTDIEFMHKIDWHPLKGGGSNFKAQKLKEKQDRITITSSSILKIIGLGVALFGLTPLIFDYLTGFLLHQIHNFSDLAAYTIHHVNLLYFILVVAGLAVRLFTGTSAIIHYRKEKIVADGKMIDFKNAKALQIINEYVVTRESGAYNSFELNLVLDDYSRLNLMDHGDLNSLIEDAKKISKVLKVPIVSISNSLSDPYKNKMHDIKAV